MSAEAALQIVDSIATAVTNLEQPDEQSEENFDLIVNVFSQIDDLIEGDEFNATEDVSALGFHTFCHS